MAVLYRAGHCAGGDADAHGRSELSLSQSTLAGCRHEARRLLRACATAFWSLPPEAVMMDRSLCNSFEDAVIPIMACIIGGPPHRPQEAMMNADERGATAAGGKNKLIHGHSLGHEFLIPLFM
ncbi:uncharacterized protein CC84DRAFT_155616 [Paraphaeosphaeria sporulosa]|uniref:Uncharacterized protein n=1 Tax=Paraphaeosphaeria sporulosa TaxID=1460663 RepID=A0A177D106_9PLEO|nr:uncharacterized protein CC84DRAFT_155616 [Paraphaeosphaeria sporulosa]OAG12699.1 hypothetical protein CC84DRAFT_155616 [Paraphaeosphaeria sporulosa]